MVHAYVANLDAVTSETFDGDTVLINFLTGTYFSLRGSAPLIWNLLGSPTTIDRIAAAISDDPTSDREAVATVIETLVTENCVLPVEADEADLNNSAMRAGLVGPVEPPVVQIFRDLQELIVVDPVHEVDQFDGWPHRPQPFALD